MLSISMHLLSKKKHSLSKGKHLEVGRSVAQQSKILISRIENATEPGKRFPTQWMGIPDGTAATPHRPIDRGLLTAEDRRDHGGAF
jgi:hypothetical protein